MKGIFIEFYKPASIRCSFLSTNAPNHLWKIRNEISDQFCLSQTMSSDCRHCRLCASLPSLRAAPVLTCGARAAPVDVAVPGVVDAHVLATVLERSAELQALLFEVVAEAAAVATIGDQADRSALELVRPVGPTLVVEIRRAAVTVALRNGESLVQR